MGKNRRHRTGIKSSIQGFTLIEVIVVMAVIGILAAIAIPRFTGFIDNANLAVCQENRGNIEKHYQYLVAAGAPGVGETGAIGAVNATLSSDEMKTYFQANSGDEFTYSDLICPKHGEITGKIEDDGTKGGRLILSCSIHTDVLFHSSFNTISQVKTLTGGWDVVNGKLVSTTAGEKRAIFNGTNGKDYTIKMDSVYLSGGTWGGGGGYGVYYRATDAAAISGYCFQFDPGAGNAFTVRKVNNGREEAALQTVKMASILGSSFKVTDPHDIEIKVVGTSHVIKVDGKEVLKFTDASFSEGNVGIRTWSDTKIQVNEVIIEK